MSENCSSSGQRLEKLTSSSYAFDICIYTRMNCLYLISSDCALDYILDYIHHILLTRMKTSFGVVGRAHEWLTSYLENRMQSVVVSGFKSESAPLTCGVPQGSVLGPNLFTDYSSRMASLNSVLQCVGSLLCR